MKFHFTIDFQFDLLRFTVLDNNGHKLIELYDDSYFTLTEHSFLAHVLKSFYKRTKRIPGKIMFIEAINTTFNHRDFINNLTDEDRKEIVSLAHQMFKGVVKDGDQILENAERFSQYVDLKHEIEGVDLLDYENYDSFSRKIQMAITPKLKALEAKGKFLVKDVRHRQVRRKEDNPVVAFPKIFNRLNRLTNAWGYSKGSIMVILDRAKKFKTGTLVNLAVGYLKLGKKVLVIDLDGGDDEFMMRVEQNLINVSKLDLIGNNEDGEQGETIDKGNDKKLRRVLKRYRTIKGELVVERMPALITTANDISSLVEYLYTEHGFQTEILILDYIAKMGAISGKDSLHERVGESYIDMDNLGKRHKIEHIWTAQHVNKEAAKLREKTVYESTDIAGAMDVSRHVQAIYGLNRTKEEEEAGYLRMEIVDQRDGPPSGSAIFTVDQITQRLHPLTKVEYEKYKRDMVPSDKGGGDDHTYKGQRKKITKNDLEKDETE